jgi:hypothetical protein
MLKMPPAVTASVASPVGAAPRREHPVADRQVARTRHDRRDRRRTEERDDAVAHGKAGHERCGQQPLGGHPEEPHRAQRDDVGVFEAGRRVDDLVEFEIVERREQDPSGEREGADDEHDPEDDLADAARGSGGEFGVRSGHRWPRSDAQFGPSAPMACGAHRGDERDRASSTGVRRERPGRAP